MIITTQNAHVPSSSLALFSYLLSPKKFLVYLIQEKKKGGLFSCMVTVNPSLFLYIYVYKSPPNSNFTLSSPCNGSISPFMYKAELTYTKGNLKTYIHCETKMKKHVTIYVQNRACLYKEDLKHIRIGKRKRTISQF